MAKKIIKKKVKKQKLPKYKIYLQYSSTSVGGEREDDSEWPTYSPVYKTFTPEHIYLTERSFQETIEIGWKPKTGNKVWILVVRYSTGDTFSSSHGNWKIIDGYKNQMDATRIGQIIRDNPTDQNVLQEKLKKDKLGENFKHFYAVWVGYFDRLEDVEIHEMTIEDISKDGLGIKYIKH